MQLKGGVNRRVAHRMLAGVADLLQGFADAGALCILARQAVFKLEHAGKYPRRDHCRRKACAFFIRPVNDFHRTFGCDLSIVQGADHLQPGQHAVNAVETAAVGLGVNVGAGDHRGQIRASAFTAQEHIAHAVDAYAAAGLQGPLAQLVARHAVFFAQGQPGHAIFRDSPELRHVEQALPQAFSVYSMRHFFSPCALAA
ncbi:hypothetical protein D3C72_1683890 [compost metagenome]